MKKILILITCVPSLIFAQSKEIIGVSRLIGKYGEGGVFKLNSTTQNTTSSYREVTYPIADFTVYNDKIYGISALEVDINAFTSIFTIFRTDSINGDLINVNRAIKLKTSQSNNFLTVHKGFSIDQNLMAAAIKNSDLMVINLENDSVIANYTYNTGTISNASPLIVADKIYHGYTNQNTFEFNVYNVSSNLITNLFSVPKTQINELNGHSFISNEFLYIISKDSFGQNIWKVNTITGSKSLVAQLSNSVGTGCYFKFNEVGDYAYNVANSGGSLGAGIIFKINKTTGLFNVVRNFDQSYSAPVGGLVQVQGKLYGLTSLKNGNESICVFELDPSNDSFRIIKELNLPMGSEHLADCLFAQNDKLYVIGSKGGQNGKGAIDEIDINGNITAIRHSYEHRLVSLGNDRPVSYNNAWYGISDSILYELKDKKLVEKFRFTGANKISGTYFNLTRISNKLYGISSSDTDSRFLFSFNLESNSFTKEIELPLSYPLNSELTQLGNNLYFLLDFVDVKKIMSFNLITKDTLSVLITNEECLTINPTLTAAEGQIYFTSLSTCALPFQTKIWRLNPIDNQLFQDLTLDVNRGYIDQTNLVYSTGNLIGNIVSDTQGVVFEFNITDKTVNYSIIDSDSLKFNANLLIDGNYIYTLGNNNNEQYFYILNLSQRQFWSKKLSEIDPNSRYLIAMIPDSVSSIAEEIKIVNSNIAYPNPICSGQILNLKNPDGLRDYIFFDRKGRLIRELKANSEIETSGLAIGEYILVDMQNQRSQFIIIQ